MNEGEMKTLEPEVLDPKAAELEKDFTYDGYQVVRRELFAHLREPAVVIRRDSVTFNTSCISGLEDAVYIQILVNPDTKKMVVRKCEENDKDALRWCIAKPDKRRSRKVTSKIFSAKMYELMDWSMDCRYKILGHKISVDNEQIYVFDLVETEIYMDRKRPKKVNNSAEEKVEKTAEEIAAEKAARALSRKAYYPEEWKDSFGLPTDEHEKALEVNIIDGFAEFNTIKKE
ncbi:hypothetical protein [Hespellia stercorisuis]|uniref:Uncharacterized protein n=1 Tax=Hespellia stercorisuis DSM 15480 TaxID=1121950 RepID=A0A1M6TKY5_9FIRM|nr:hypothetical protein [Hespellia stercorisuis]SHK57594.1 hypothetical protein SAMN02745243_03264 [Hespellia stercorisuis DSM 15480]